MSTNNEQQNRRQWFKAATRWAVLGGCAVGSAVLLTREGNCRPDMACNDCGKLANCDLPQAVSAKRDSKGSSNAR
jgi:hypothetical protein